MFIIYIIFIIYDKSMEITDTNYTVTIYIAIVITIYKCIYIGHIIITNSEDTWYCSLFWNLVINIIDMFIIPHIH